MPAGIQWPNTQGANFLSCGNVSLPDGDWAIFCAFKAGAYTTQTTNVLFCIGAQSDTIYAANSSLTMTYTAGTAAATSDKFQIVATGIDSDGTNFGTRNIGEYWNLTGITVQALGGLDARSLTSLYVIQRSGSEIQLWQCPQGGMAVCVHKAFNMSGWGGFSAQPLLIGAYNRVARGGYPNLLSSMTRFGRVKKALTAAQMEAIMNGGVDPVALLSMNSPDGDLYWAFAQTSALTNAQTINDSVQGQTATVTSATFATPASDIVPASPLTNYVSVMTRPFMHMFANPGTIRVDGTCVVASGTCDIQARVVVDSGSTTVVDWTTIASSVASGDWTGQIGTIPRDLTLYRLEVRQVIGGTPQTAVTQTFTPAICLQIMGQSLAEYMRVFGAVSSGQLSNFYGFVGPTCPPASGSSNYLGAPQENFRHGYWQLLTNVDCYGEWWLDRTIQQAAGCAVVSACDAQQGSSIGQWNTISAQSLFTRASESIRRMGECFILWEQGQADTGSPGTYAASLDTLITNLNASHAGRYQFGISPLALTLSNSSQSATGILRLVQYNWARDRIAAGDGSYIFLADNNANDLTLADLIHQTSNAAGSGCFAERWAQTILQRCGVTTYSGLGPDITSAQWDGASTIDLTVTHNGGTGLQTPLVANITGFETSVNGGSSWQTPSTAAITGASTIRLTGASAYTSAPLVRYQSGGPGPNQTTGTDAERRTAAGIDNPVYDNRTPAINTTRGYPVAYTRSSIQSSVAGAGGGAGRLPIAIRIGI